ncbi:MAG: hypothetical protein IKZ21_05590 [Clostridia bacterium]|nr:hypothetical protein [Clostridia bacterium]
MKRNLFLWQFFGYTVTVLGGILLHFLYEWSGQSRLAALFSGVNESTWEHMKLLFFPMFFFALIQSRYFDEYDGFWCIKLRGIVTGLALIPILFYTFNGSFGKSPDWLNIGFFFGAAAGAVLVETRLFERGMARCRNPLFAFGWIMGIGILFVAFTFFTPELPLFADPLTGGYGIGI